MPPFLTAATSLVPSAEVAAELQTLGARLFEVHVAPVKLREIRLEQFTMEEVDAVVVDTQLSVSLLGMSFLKRLEGYELRDGALVVSW